MTKTEVTFNGVTLTDDFVVSGLTRPFLQRKVNMTQVDGRDGAIYRSSSYEPIEIRMRLAFLSEDKGERVMALANLVKALDVDEPAPLAISDDNGWYYLAVPSGGDISRWIGAEEFPLTFHCPDPRRYGEDHAVYPWPKPPYTEIVGGNVPVFPRFMLNATPSEGYFSFYYRTSDISNINDMGFLMFQGVSVGIFEIDCETRTCRYSSNGQSDWVTLVPAIGSRFIEIAPGKAIIPGSVTVGSIDSSRSRLYWTDRWL